MTTLNVKSNAILSIDDDPPAVPAYLHPVPSGMAVILVRQSHSPRWTEHWCAATAYVDEAEEATPIEVEAYLSGFEAERLYLVDDIPEPVTVPDQEVWDACHDEDEPLDFYLEAGVELDFDRDLMAA